MKWKIKLILTFSFIAAINYGQFNPKFVTYGSIGNPKDGDNNKIQAINFLVPDKYIGNVSVRIFDADASEHFDSKFGEYNSHFRFSLFRNEYKEEDLISFAYFSQNHYADLIHSFIVGDEIEFDNNWVTVAEITKTSSMNDYFTLFVEGLDGNDANVFEVYLSSNKNENIEIPGSLIYSFQPSIRLSPTMDKITLRFFVDDMSDEIFLHTFDYDKTRIYMSTILRDDVPLVENNPTEWSKIKFKLNQYESNNWIGLNYGPLKIDYNDVNFKITDKYGNSIRLPMNFENKKYNSVPKINLVTNYLDCNNVELDLSTSYDNSGNELFFKSKIGGTFISNKEKFFMNFPNAGNYQLEVFAESKSDAITRAKIQEFTIRTNSAPIAKAGLNFIAGVGDKIRFDGGKSIDYDGTIKNYTWDFDDGNIAYDKISFHSFSNSGLYNVTLKVVDDFNSVCNYDIDTVIVQINAKPVAVVEKNILGAVGQELAFDASGSYDTDGSIILYSWDFGKFGTNKGQKIMRRFSSPGKFRAKLTVKDNSGATNSFNSTDFEIIINSPPIADAGSNKFVGTKEMVFLDAMRSYDSDGSIVSYYWDFGDGSSAFGKIVNHSYAEPGAYTVKLTVTDNSNASNNFNTSTITIFVNHPPIPKIETDKFLNDRSTSFNASYSYDPDGEILSYEWNFGDNTFGTGKVISHKYFSPGTYNVTLTVRDNSMKSNNVSSIVEQIIINSPPIADAGRDMVIAPFENLFLSSSSSVDPDGNIKAVKWFINNQLVSEQKDFTFSFDVPGTYNVGLEVMDDFPKPLTNVDYSVIKVNSQPIAKIWGNSVVAPNQIVKLNAINSYDYDGRITNFKWFTDLGEIFEGREIELKFSEPNTYRIILQVVDDANVNNSIARDTFYLKVNSSPIISLRDEIESCNSFVSLDASASYDPDGDDLSFTWVLPGQVEIIGSSVLNYSFTERGIIPVLLIVNDLNNVSNSVSKKSTKIKLNNTPVADAGNDTTICAGDVAIFSAMESYDIDKSELSYLWKFEDGSEFKGQNAIKKFKSGGVYKATLFVDDNSGLDCSISRDEKIIIVNDGPVANAGIDIVGCSYSPIRFDGSRSTDIDGEVNSFEWDFGDGEKGSGVNPIHIYEKAGNYKVTLTVFGDLNGDCDNTDKDEINVSISEAPTVKFNIPKIVAQNQQVVFDASLCESNSGNIFSYEWDFGDGNVSKEKITQHSYSEFGKYRAKLKIITDGNGNCNQSLLEKSIIVNASPICNYQVPVIGAINEIIRFDASQSSDPDGKIMSYQWDFGDGEYAEGIEVDHIYKSSGIYYPKITLTDNSGAINSSVTINFEIKINSSPVPVLTVPIDIYINAPIILDASSSYDSDGEIISYKWVINENPISTDKYLTYSFSKVGFYKIKLIIEDDSNQNNSTSEIVKTITVHNVE